MKRKKLSICVLFLVLMNVFAGFGSSFEVNVETEYDFVIVSPEIFCDQLQTLQAHKENFGIRTIIISLEDIYSELFFPLQGRDGPEQIKYFLKNAVENWGVEYVMFVGGKDIMPVRYVHTRGVLISDLYFADIYPSDGSFCSWDSNGNDLFGELNETNEVDEVDLYPDVCVGRLLCSNVYEVTVVVDKIIDYETNTFGQGWFDNLILTGGDEYGNVFFDYMLLLAFNKWGRSVFEGEYMGNSVATLLSDFQAKKIYASGFLRPDAQTLSKENIHNAVNDGAGFLLMCGHGSPRGIATHPPFNTKKWIPELPGFSISDVRNLSNNHMLPVTVLCACSCGDFDKVDSPIAWEFVKKENGGAIACFAPSVSAIIFGTTLTTETLFGHLTFGVFKSYAAGTDIVGEIWGETITNYLDDEQAWSIGCFNVSRFQDSFVVDAFYGNYVTLEEWMLFGDPTLKIGGYE